jgi:hypothetical protein
MAALLMVTGAAFVAPGALTGTNASAVVRGGSPSPSGTHNDAVVNLLGAYAALSPNPAAPPPPAIPTELLVPATHAQPAPTVDTPGSAGAAALATIHYPYEKLGYQIQFLAPRSGYLGMTYCSQHLIQVYVNPGESVGTVSFITAFELAHAVDCTYNTAATRATWAQARGFSRSAAWFPPCSCNEDNYGSGDFADVFATWLQGPQWWKWRSNLAPPPTSEQLLALMPELEPAAIFG